MLYRLHVIATLPYLDFSSLRGRTSYRKISWCLEAARFAPKFDRRLGSTAEMAVEFHSDTIITTPIPVASRDVRPLSDKRPRLCYLKVSIQQFWTDDGVGILWYILNHNCLDEHCESFGKQISTQALCNVVCKLARKWQLVLENLGTISFGAWKCVNRLRSEVNPINGTWAETSAAAQQTDTEWYKKPVFPNWKFGYRPYLKTLHNFDIASSRLHHPYNATKGLTLTQTLIILRLRHGLLIAFMVLCEV